MTTDNRARTAHAAERAAASAVPARARRWRPGPRPAQDLAALPDTELTPRVRSAVMRLMDELDRLTDELLAANERVSQLEGMADEDPLLPVLNRRGFERELARTLAYVKRYGSTATLVYMDLDDFKGVNDRFGHAGGDAALKHFAEVLLGNVRRSDVVGRLGGDEFAVVLHHADVDAAARKAAQLSQQIVQRPARFDRRDILLGITAGATELRADDTVESVLERADAAMYQGKARRLRR